ncbi:MULTISPECIES: phosphate ABC transporter permease subunit PstC [unclassified Guyparkeria]|uniref:phosphate ABC transporter permease subunit PstC n=1 Tax=unclassified Guyparkeria TaxID=2626246 RepID=UPI0007339622|nr:MULTISPECIES: phosphate ABC transporter permease subunit PstC [unclassified Guyparkeria]KTG16886.1 phosphate ABC transporter permease [Guyparkeria sp. XI15]OAE85920.1 phosphate ABC transporter permease [Guyparkeria sp. WRN-7]
MQTDHILMTFFAGVILLGALGFYLGRTKAARTRAGGAHMHSQPDQYAWFAVLTSAGPAVIVAFLAAIVLGLFENAFPGWLAVAGSLGLGAFGLFLGLNRIRPELRARDSLERAVKWTLLAAASVSILTTFGILFSILFEAIRFFQMESFWYFITGTNWAPGDSFLEAAGRAEGGEGPSGNFGAVPLFAGTFMITAIAMLVAVPIGVSAAIYMSEYAPASVRTVAKPVLEVLAGIPTVVYGFFAAITVAPLIVSAANSVGVDASFNNALAPGIVMGIMIIPFISSLSDDVISSVPNTMRQGSLALGTTRNETIRFVVLPAALPGIISATLLGVSRALGETMIVVMAAGMRPNLTANPFEDMTTVTVSIVSALTGDNEFESAATLSAFALGLVLFVVTLALNFVSVLMIRRFRRKYAVNNL